MWNDYFEENFYDPKKINIMIERALVSATFCLLCIVSFSTPGVNGVFGGVVAGIAFVWRFVNDILLMRKFDKERYALMEQAEKERKN